MKKIAFLISFFFSLAAFGQITVNTNFQVNSNLPIDARDTLTTLADTSGVTWTYPGLLSYARDVDQFWYFTGSFWKQLETGAGDPTMGGALTGTASNAGIAAGAVGTTEIANNAVTLAKQATGTANRIMGYDGSGNPSEITAGSGLNFTGTTLSVNIPDSSFIRNDSIFMSIRGTAYYTGRRGHYVTPQQFGAIPNDNIDDSGAISLALREAGRDGVVFLSPGDTFLIANRIDDVSNNWPVTILGYGAVLKRANAVVSTLKRASSTSHTFIVVDHPDTFAVGNNLVILDVSAAGGGIKDGENSLSLTISSISNDTLFLTGTVGGAYDIGDKVLKIFPMFNVSENLKTEIYGVTFYGNRSNNAHHWGWEWNACISRTGPGSVIEHCRFLEVPNEGVIVGRGTRFVNNYGNNLNGSMTHISQSPGQTYIGNIILSGNICQNCTIISLDTTGHGDAVFTFSANSDSVIITNNIAVNTIKGEGFVGPIDAANDNVTVISNNFAANFRAGVVMKVTDSGAGGPTAEPGPLINNNYFYNCAHLQSSLTGGGDQDLISHGEAVIGAKITNNILVNTIISLLNCVGCTVSGNTMWIDSSYLRNNTTPTNLGIAISVDGIYNNISNNFLYNDKWSKANLEVGIAYSAGNTPALIDRVGIDTIYTKRSNTKIFDNWIIGFNRCVDDRNTSGSPRPRAVWGTEIYGNTMFQRDSASATNYVVRAVPGVTLYNNRIYARSSASRGIDVIGVAAAQASKINGPIVYNNTIMGCSESIQIGNNSNTCYNMTVVNNFYGGTLDIRDAGSVGNTIQGNIKLPVNENIPIDVLRIRRDMN